MTQPTDTNRCPGCGKKVVQEGEDGKLKIRTSMVLFAKGSLVGEVVCSKCGTAIPVDLRMGPALVKSLKRPKIRLKVR